MAPSLTTLTFLVTHYPTQSEAFSDLINPLPQMEYS